MSEVKVTQSPLTLCDPWTPWNSPGKNTGVGSLSLLQGVFPTQELNPGLPYCRQIFRQLSHKGSPRILEWVAFPFFRGPSQPRDWTQVSCTAGGFFTSWATREPKNTGVHSLSLLQWIFLTQDRTGVSCICSRILYQLSYQGMMVRLNLILIIYSLNRVKRSRKKNNY